MASSTTTELATRHANGTNGVAQSDIFEEAYLPPVAANRRRSPSIAPRWFAPRKGVRESAQSGRYRRSSLVECGYPVVPQHRFARVVQLVLAIEDFTGTMSLEFLDYTLSGASSSRTVRQRDLTYEMPMKVRFVSSTKTGGEKRGSIWVPA